MPPCMPVEASKHMASKFSWGAERGMNSGQALSPRVEIDGKMPADISGEEVEAWSEGNPPQKTSCV